MDVDDASCLAVAIGVVAPRWHRAEILAVGAELLTPFRSDTNSLYLTSRLNELGLDVQAKSVVTDDLASVEAAVRLALSRADVVVTTGGLGPTDDDVTRAAIAAAIGVTCDEDAEVVAAIEARFAARDLPMPAINRRQAHVPRGALVLVNPNGTAPGLWCEIGGKVVIALPGPPRELKPMYDASVLPRLRLRCGALVLCRRTVRVAGRGESHVEEVAAPIYGPWLGADPAIHTTILASLGVIELHLSAQGEDVTALDRALDAAVRELTHALAWAQAPVDWAMSPTTVMEPLSDRRVSMRSCIGERSWASSTTM
jgi:nicotinamide-nucleotide amidase